jgi:hypothetical protein
VNLYIFDMFVSVCSLYIYHHTTIHPSTTQSNVTFGDVYSSQCVIRGVQPEQPLVTYRDMMSQVDPSSISQAERLLVYNRICTEQVRVVYVCVCVVDVVPTCIHMYTVY